MKSIVCDLAFRTDQMLYSPGTFAVFKSITNIVGWDIWLLNTSSLRIGRHHFPITTGVGTIVFDSEYIDKLPIAIQMEWSILYDLVSDL